MNDNTRVQESLKTLVELGEELLGTEEWHPDCETYIGDPRVEARWVNQTTTRLAQVFGPDHRYPTRFESVYSRRLPSESTGPDTHWVERGLGILEAALDDVERGLLATLQEMASAEVFSSFLDQAGHLLQEGYHVPAASLAGAVLEDGMRSLATREGIAVKARDNLQSLNSKIADKGVYNRIRQKQVSVWIDVRNAADHGRFKDFTDKDVADLIKGVRSLLSSFA